MASDREIPAPAPPSPPSPRDRLFAALFASAVVALGTYGAWFWSSLPGRLPSASDWAAARELLGQEARSGDAVVVDPWWAERARAVLPAELPVLAFPRLAGEDLLDVRRVWRVALPRAPGQRPGLARDVEAAAGPARERHAVGRLEITRHDLPAPVVPLAFLPDRLHGAKVALGGLACAMDARGAFRCAGPAPMTVAREVREVDLLPRHCVLVHLLGRPAAPLTITFRDVPIGRTLRGHTGIVGESALAGSAPVRLAIAIDGEQVAAPEEPPRSPGWHRFQVDTASRAGRSAEVALTVTTKDEAPRPLCLDAYTLP